MAIANSDGSIILSTKVDTSGINKGMSQMQGKATSLTKTFSKLGAAIASAFAIQKIIQFSNEAGQLATQTEASVQRLVDIYGSASDSVGNFIDQNARALGMSKAAAASFSSVYGNLFSVWADQATNAELTNRYLNMTAVVASKTGRTVEDVQERVRSGLLGNTEAIEDLGIFVNVKTIEMTDAFQRMANGKSWEQLDAYTQQQIRSMAILEQATAKYGDEVADTSATIRNRYKAAYEDFQNSWGNIVNTVLLPVLETLTRIFDIATKGLNVLSGRSGQILENVELQEESTDNTAKNIKEQTENQKDLNKELKKTLAGFDELQILSKPKESGVDGITGIGSLGLENDSFDGSNYVEEIDETMTAIMIILSGALVALGVILLFNGSVGWGIGFIIAGAGAFSVSVASISDDSVTQKAKDELVALMAVVAYALIAIGVICIICGAIPIGIGLIIAGAGSFVGAVKVSGGVFEAIKTTFNTVTNWLQNNPLLSLFLGIIFMTILYNPIFGYYFLSQSVIGIVKGNASNDILFGNLVDKIKEVFNSVVRFWKENIAVYFTFRWWSNLAKNCGNGLIGGFEAAINGIITMFEKMINWIVDGINAIGFDLPDWLGGGHFGFNIPRASFGRVKIPRLAQGAVIPPNREFLAVLGDQKQGTNIEAPLSTIQDAVASVIGAQNEGVQATLEEILSAILGIQIGDEVIGRASQRYNNTMTKIYGG